MSDLAAAAAVIGAPEELVAKSAEARAAATGSTAEEVLTAWAGGSSAPTGAAPAAATPAPPPQETPAEAAVETPQAATTASSAPEPATTAVQPAAALAATPPIAVAVADHRKDAAPLLTGRTDRVWTFLLGVTGLFVLGIIFAVSLPAQDGAAIASEQAAVVAFSDEALSGRDIYIQEGCFYCHTQQVRSVVTDVNLGKVSEPGSAIAFGTDNYGFQRIGPDLTHVGSREPTNDAAWLENFLTAPRTVRVGSLQPSYAYLSEADMAALVQYLLELE